MRKMTMVLLVMFSLVLWGCASGDPTPATPVTPTDDPEPASGGEVIIGLERDPERLVTVVRRMRTGVPVHQLIYSSLLQLDEDLEPQPDLAESYEISEDGRTITFYLREDVVFHDGEPLTAHDVAFTYNLMGHPDYVGGMESTVIRFEGLQDSKDGKTDGLSGIQVLNDYTISFTMTDQFAPIWGSFDLGIMPKHILEDRPVADLGIDPFNYNAIGSGPFRLVEYEPDRHIIVDAHDDYFLGRPNLDRIIVRIASPEALLGSWLAGEMDATPIPPGEFDAVANAAHGDPYEFIEPAMHHLRINCQSVFFEDARVRRAVSYAISRQDIVDIVLQGRGMPISQPHPMSWGYNPDIVIEQDLDKAAELMDAAGWTLNPNTGLREKDGVPFIVEMWHLSGTAFDTDIALMVQSYLDELGMEVSLRSMDSSALWSALLPRDQPLDPETYHFMVASTLLTTADPDWKRSALHSSFHPPAGRNHLLFSDAELDEMLEYQATLMDFDERRDYWHNELWPLILEHSPYVGLVQPAEFYAVHNRLEGFSPGPHSRVNNVLNWTVTGSRSR